MRATRIQLMIGISVLAGLAGISSPSAAQSAAMDTGMAVRTVCLKTLKVGHSGLDLDACTSSLSDTLSLKQQIARDIDIERHCSMSGILPGAAAYQKCEADGEAASHPVHPTVIVTELFGMPHAQDLGPIADFGVTNYYGMSFDSKRHQEEEACTQIGVDPEISGCVASLDAALSVADSWNP
jgi:hypothetical protein